MGDSGAGKSTLLYSLSGMDRPSLGAILFGNDVRFREGSYYNSVEAYLWTTGSDSDAKAMFDDHGAHVISPGGPRDFPVGPT